MLWLNTHLYALCLIVCVCLDFFFFSRYPFDSLAMFASPLPAFAHSDFTPAVKKYMSPIDWGTYNMQQLIVDKFPNEMQCIRGLTATKQPVKGLVISDITFDGIMVSGGVRGFYDQDYNIAFSFPLHLVYDMQTGAPRKYPSPFHVALGTNKYRGNCGFYQRQYITLHEGSTVGGGVELEGQVSVIAGGKVSITVYNRNRHCYEGINAVITDENHEREQAIIKRNKKNQGKTDKDGKPIPLEECYPVDLREHCCRNGTNTLCDVCPVYFYCSFSVQRFLPVV